MSKFSFILGLLVLASSTGDLAAQCKTFKLTDRGDTINCVDRSGRKQGPWLVTVPELRGTPGYEEEGRYLDDKRDGIWRKYSQEGDLMAVESYKWGLLNGKSQYYSVLGLEREESWWAMDPTKEYDTIDVQDLYEDSKYRKVVIKNEGYSMRHGKWTYYDPTTGFVQRSEEFIRDSSVNPLAMFGVSNKRKEPPTDSKGNKKPVEKPQVVQDYEKKNAGKKKIRVRDGSTGG